MTDALRVLIVEDEPRSAEQLAALLAEVAPHAEILARLASVEATVAWLAAHSPPSLIFCDIELQDGAIFDALRRSRSLAPVIFTTAYDRFVLDAFRAQGIAYLQKPITAGDLADALAKYAALRRGFADGMLDALARDLRVPAPARRHFTVKAGKKIRVLPVERVAVIALGKAGVELVDTANHAHFPSGAPSLAELERGLPAAQFFRISRTEIVALAAIDHVEPVGEQLRIALKAMPRTCTVSVHRTAAFRAWLGL